MKVFIADDSKLLRERLVELLNELADVDVVGQTGNAFEAVHSIERLRPQGVILDIRMPGGSGIDVLKKIKRDHPGTTVIVFTNYPLKQYRKKCMELGADFFFDKSTEFDKVAEVFRRLSDQMKADGIIRA